MAATPTTPDGEPAGSAQSRGPTPLARLASWALELSAPDFVAGRLVDGKRGADGVWIVGYWADSPVVMKFHGYCYADGWVSQQLNWGEWAKTGRGHALLHDIGAIADADTDELAALLTTILRADRFTEGYMGTKFRDGTMLAICRRAGELARTS